MNGEEKFLGFYKEFKDKIYNYFWYRVDFNRSLAEDLTAEVFLKAWANFSLFDQSRSFQAWIYAIAHNHLCNYYRAAGQETELDESVIAPADPGESADIAYQTEQVMAAIRELPPYRRDVLLLRYVDGFTNQEIARLLGREEGAIRTQICRTLGLLRIKLKKYG